jgi:peptidoglycan-N-acetylglucosamine deacetylase
VAPTLPDAEVERLDGDSRFSTAVAVSQRIAPDGASMVYVASGREWPDALAASPAAARAGVPLLLVEPTQLPPETAAELSRLDPDVVVLVGGEAAASEAVAVAVGNAARADVTRISGPSRFDTAAAVVEEGFDGTVDTVLVAAGESFADALASGAASAVMAAPLLLVGGQAGVPRVTREQLQRLQPDDVVIVGGEAAVARHVARQLAAIPTGDFEQRDPQRDR